MTACTSGSSVSALTMACSRAPVPMTRTFTWPSVEKSRRDKCAASRGGRGHLPGTPRIRRAVAWRGNLQLSTWVDGVD